MACRMPLLRLLLVVSVAAACALQAVGAQRVLQSSASRALMQGRKYSCDAVGQVPEEERCSFVRASCPAESKINYSQLYYCHVAARGALLRGLFVLFVLLVLPLLFCLLGDTTELYFAPIMAAVSQTVPKMRPRFAGVTFVALGNGAPDLSSNISAIKGGEVQLSAGALTGAAMFIQCIVASELIRIGGGVKCAGAMMRDVCTYCLSIFSVLVAFWLGWVTQVFIAWAVTVYVVYVIWVFIGDEWHERGRPQLDLRAGWLSLQSRLGLRHRGSQLLDDFEEGLLPWAAVEDEPAAAGQQQQQQQRRLHSSRSSTSDHELLAKQDPSRGRSTFVDWEVAFQGRRRHNKGGAYGPVDAKTYRQLVWADLAGDPDIVEEQLVGPAAAGGGTAAAGSYQPPILSMQQQQQGQGQGQQMLPGEQELLGAGQQQQLPQEPQEQQQGARSASLLLEAADWPGVWEGLRRDITLGACHEWDEGNVLQRSFRAVSYPLLLPIYLALRLTIPIVDAGSYSQQWLVASLLCYPLAAVVYFKAFHMGAILLAMGLGAGAGGLVYWATRDEPDQPPELKFGGSFAWGPASFSLLGFFMGVLWIDSIANEVVGVISFLASLADAPAGVMGLTLMAWGNSLGDFFGNVAMAKAGQTSMAFTACFAGPLFNMLMSLALGYSSYFAREGVRLVAVELTPEVALGCAFLMVHCAAIVGVGLACGSRLPWQFYIFSRAWYGLYFVLACWLGMSHAR